ncbi:MAG: hypothetical protein JWL77_1018 [Chthonomonadaceae bacterium]|nr:hypothetical protein [Chthonomonadaceae bacterium]
MFSIRPNTHKLYKAVFADRLRLALKRQPDYDPNGTARGEIKLARLCAHLDALKSKVIPGEKDKYDTPYELSKEDWDSLREVEEYGQGGKGRRAACEQTTPDRSFFRITSIGSLLGNPTITWRTRDYPMDTQAQFYAELLSQTEDGKKWTPLREFGDGEFSGACQFSWWTDFVVDPSDIIYAALRLGLTETATGTTTVLLRAPLRALLTRDQSIVRVPNSLDAFTNPIFLPIACAQSVVPPVSGITIPLENFPELNPAESGEREYAIRPIPIDEIEILPVLTSLEHRNISKRNPVKEADLLPLLAAYYAALP